LTEVNTTPQKPDKFRRHHAKLWFGMAGKYSKKRKHGALHFSSFFFRDTPPKKAFIQIDQSPYAHRLKPRAHSFCHNKKRGADLPAPWQILYV
tara:strand:+ start:260 stop:538 length:279 start_codon:yes stop_codon:yes gene_type:complete